MATKLFSFVLCCVVLSTMLGCQSKQLKPVSYCQYVENVDHGLRKKIEVGDWNYDIQYKPTAYLLCNEFKKENISKAEYTTAQQAKKGFIIFTIKIKNKRYENKSMLKLISKNYKEYTDLFTYMMSEVKNSLTLLYQNKLIKPTVYQYEANFDVSPYDVMLIGFSIEPESEPSDAFTLTYDDKILKNGIIKCQISKTDLQNLPSLQTLN